jgi:signal transduction histidine kinase
VTAASTRLRACAARQLRAIHPALLSERGLCAALEALAQRTPLPIELGAAADAPVPERVEAAAYFVVAEAITNFVGYVQASHACVAVAPR